MESQFNNRDFEKLLRDNANQYRMYPSEKVWKGVHSALHTRRKWYGISTLAILMLTGSIISLFVLYNSSDNRPVISEVKNTLSAEKVQILLPQPLEEKSRLRIDVSKQDNTDHGSVRSIKTTSEKIITGPDNLVSVQSNDETVANNFQPGKITDETEAAENSMLEKQITPAQIITSDPENKNLSSETIEKEMSTDSKIKDAINALASFNAPIIISKKHSGFSTRVYFTPTISYRKLTENKRSFTNSPFAYSQVIDINNIVNHKPLMGAEFGLEGIYRVNNILSFKTGFQFNINRYDISAYAHPTEIATVAINRGYSTYSLSSLSDYGNLNGTNQNWLENFYFQAALPVGAEITLAERKKFSWGISGTIQPTYVIGDRAYLISSDYKNYAKFPDLMRRWNISSGLETFVSYSTGRIKWQAGPHVRYQHLSSFVSGYPVKENLFAIGLQLGATFNKK